MKKYAILLLSLICFVSYSFSQSVTIDYSYAGLNSNCNVFANSTVFQNHAHQTSFGFPYFSSSDGAIVLKSKPISSTKQGATQYSVAFTFKQGFRYQIQLYGKSTLGGSSSALPSAAVILSTTNGGTNTSTNCSARTCKRKCWL